MNYDPFNADYYVMTQPHHHKLRIVPSLLSACVQITLISMMIRKLTKKHKQQHFFITTLNVYLARARPSPE